MPSRYGVFSGYRTLPFGVRDRRFSEAEGNRMATVAADAQEAVLKTPILEVILEFLPNLSGQGIALHRRMRLERRVILRELIDRLRFRRLHQGQIGTCSRFRLEKHQHAPAIETSSDCRLTVISSAPDADSDPIWSPNFVRCSASRGHWSAG